MGYDRGAKIMVLLGYIPLTTKQVHWLEFVTMSTVKMQGLFVSHVKGLCQDGVQRNRYIGGDSKPSPG